MRRLALVLAAAFALPASAQTHLADSTGGYVGIQSLSFGSGGKYLGVSGDVVLGWRRADGLDFGLRVGGDGDDFWAGQVRTMQSEFRIGPAVGYTRPLGRGLLGRVEGAALYETFDYRASGEVLVYNPDLDGPETVSERTVGSHRLSGSVTAALARPVRLVGSVRLHPTLGGYVAADGFARYSDSAYPSTDPSARVGAGVHLGLPLSFRLFGQDVAVASYARIPLTQGFRGVTGPHAGGGLRLNF